MLNNEQLLDSLIDAAWEWAQAEERMNRGEIGNRTLIQCEQKLEPIYERVLQRMRGNYI